MKTAIFVIALAIFSISCSNQCETGAICGDYNIVGPSAPSPTPTPAVGSTPNPCGGALTGVELSGDITVKVGDVFKVHVTPISSVGHLEGPLDYCNVGRVPFVETISDNIRCVGSCSSFGPQFLAQSVGPFSVKIRVDSQSSTFSGTVVR